MWLNMTYFANNMQTECKQNANRRFRLVRYIMKGNHAMKIYVNNRDFKVFFAITFKYKRFYIYTGLQTTEKFSGMIFPKSDKSAKAKTARLANLYADVENYVLSHPNDTVEELKDHLQEVIKGAKKSDASSFVSYIRKIAETKGRYNTQRNYERVARAIETYDKDCTFESVDKKWIVSYIEHERRKGRKDNGIQTDIQILKFVFNRAIEDELTDKFPFRGVSVRKEQTKKRCLSLEQLRAIRDFKLSGKKAMYRDCFMLSFYLIGINISDLLFLPKTALKNGRIIYKRNKTGKLYDIKVEPEAMEIIVRHKSRKKDRLLSFLEEGDTTITNTFANNLTRHLRTIGEKERHSYYVTVHPIEEGITSYWSRHTWATMASELDIPMEVIGRSLGHSLWDNAVTSTYIKYDTKKIDEANRKVIDYLNADLECNKDNK